MLSCIKLFATPWTAACQARLSMGFSSKNTRMDCHFLLQGVLQTQRLNLHLLYTHTHTQSVIKETKLSQCCNSHYHLQNENDSWCKGNNDQSQLPKNTPRKPSKNWVLRTVLSKVYVCVLSSRNWVHGHLFVTPWTADSQASLSVESSRKEHWSRLPFPPAGDLPDPGTEPESPVSPALVGGLHWRAAWEPNSVLHQPLMSLQPKTQLRTRMLLTHSTHQAVFFLFQSQKQKRTSLSKSFFKMKTCIVFFFSLHCLCIV